MDTNHWPQGIELVKPKEGSQKPQALNCPRCNSSHTKFCYYNNYSLSQPRYFCKTCRRYWTVGGSLRNVPVGGVCRKNKRSSSKKQLLPDYQNPNKIHEGQDPNLSYPLEFSHQPNTANSFESMNSNNSNTFYPSGLAFPEFKPNPSFSLDGLQSASVEGARLFFPFVDLKQVSNTIEFEKNRGYNGYWN